ncbi:hypothetical protein R1flu_014182 [Riccia fluitans]|uniref:Uncharacterized protein n=1 Tax=Riccia fluitans TaxID=41844 RepID=A0ABD1YFQ5_9MARC
MAYRKETTYSCAKNWNVLDSSMNSPRYVRWGESNKIPELRIEPGWTLLVMEGGKKNWYWWRNDTGWVERRTVTGVSTLLKIDNEISNRSSNHKNQRRVKNWQCYSDEEESGGQSATEPAEALPETGMAVNRNCVNRNSTDSVPISSRECLLRELTVVCTLEPCPAVVKIPCGIVSTLTMTAKPSSEERKLG